MLLLCWSGGRHGCTRDGSRLLLLRFLSNELSHRQADDLSRFQSLRLAKFLYSLQVTFIHPDAESLHEPIVSLTGIRIKQQIQGINILDTNYER
jgi:hypothetical protein